MFGIELSTFVQILFWLIVAVLIGIAILIVKLGKAPPAAAGTWQSTAQKAIATRDIHLADDVYKQSPLYPALQHLDQVLKNFAATAKADAAQVGNAVQGAVSNAAASLRAPAVPAASVPSVPTANPGEGIETYAARVGVDAAAMRLLAGLHPADTWETLADRIRNPSNYFTDADHDTVAAAASTAGLAVNR